MKILNFYICTCEHFNLPFSGNHSDEIQGLFPFCNSSFLNLKFLSVINDKSNIYIYIL